MVIMESRIDNGFLLEGDLLYIEDEALTLGQNAGRTDRRIVQDETDLINQFYEIIKTKNPAHLGKLLDAWTEKWTDSSYFEKVYDIQLFDLVNKEMREENREMTTDEMAERLMELRRIFWDGFFEGLKARKIYIFKIGNEMMKRKQKVFKMKWI